MIPSLHLWSMLETTTTQTMRQTETEAETETEREREKKRRLKSAQIRHIATLRGFEPNDGVPVALQDFRDLEVSIWDYLSTHHGSSSSLSLAKSRIDLWVASEKYGVCGHLCQDAAQGPNIDTLAIPQDISGLRIHSGYMIHHNLMLQSTRCTWGSR